MNIKVALITGASRRIGAAICKRLHQAGFCIIIHCHHSVDEAIQLCADFNAIRDNSSKVVVASLDIICRAHELHDFVQQVLVCFGRLDVLVHNASSFYASDIHANWHNLYAHWQDLFLTNAQAPFFLSVAFLPYLQQTRGQIVSILDIHAHDKPFVGYSIYTMAKSAHRTMVQALALECAPDIRINGVAPGANILPEYFDEDTRQTLQNTIPLGRIGIPDDIANAVCFLIDATYITGQIIVVDGGRSLTIKDN